MKLLLQLLVTFFKIGLFTLGGGYAMLPIIQDEIVYKRNWIDSTEFLELLAIAQSAPGPVAVNTAVFIGCKVAGLKGSFVATLGSILPSFLIILILAVYISGLRKFDSIEAAFKALRPAVVALILVPVIRNSKQFNGKIFSYLVAIMAALAVTCFSLSPIYVVLAAAFSGLITGLVKESKNVREKFEK